MSSVEVSLRAAFLMPSSVRDVLFADTTGPWGTLHAKWDVAQQLGVITAGTHAGTDGFESKSPFVTQHRSRYADLRTDFGIWYRAHIDTVCLWADLYHRRAAVATHELAQLVPQGWRAPPGDGSVQLVVTLATVDGEPTCRAWNIDSNIAAPIALTVVEEARQPLQDLAGLWPLKDLDDASVVLVGLGSLGTPAALALPGYGIRNLTLIDPDRLEQRNLIRHGLDESYIGHFKVSGVRDLINAKWPDVNVTPLALDVITDADTIRPIMRDASIVLASPDGVAPRQAVNHLTRWAQTPAVFAAIFDDGGLGEIIRIRPGPDDPCLTCVRTVLLRDQVLEPERTLDKGYGTGQIHRPMTAVGPDIALVGILAAKVTIATLLEQRGHADQALPGSHLVIGLRPVSGLRSPFDVPRPLSVNWHDLTSSQPDCPDCKPA